MKKTTLTALLFGAFIALAAAPAVDVQAKIKSHIKLPSFNLINTVSADNTKSDNAAAVQDATPALASSTDPLVPVPATITPPDPTPTTTSTSTTDPTPVQDPTPLPVTTPAPIFTPVPEPVTEPAPTPDPTPAPVKSTSKSTTKDTAATTSATSSTPFSGTLDGTTPTANIYNTSNRLSPDMTRTLLELALLCGAVGLVLAQERGLRTTLSRVWG